VQSIAYLGRCGLETAMQSDREWFARNPHRAYRIRREIPGEFPARRSRIDTTKWTVWTLVRQLEPGIRIRISLGVRCGAEPVDTDPSIEALFGYVIENPNAPIKINSPGGEIVMGAFLPPMQGVA
jgi:hypothetical protein